MVKIPGEGKGLGGIGSSKVDKEVKGVQVSFCDDVIRTQSCLKTARKLSSAPGSDLGTHASQIMLEEPGRSAISTVFLETLLQCACMSMV
jgi:hypothetical protein